MCLQTWRIKPFPLLESGYNQFFQSSFYFLVRVCLGVCSKPIGSMWLVYLPTLPMKLKQIRWLIYRSSHGSVTGKGVLKQPLETQPKLGDGFNDFFHFHPYLGKWSKLTNVFQMGWNHHLAKLILMFFHPVSSAGKHQSHTFSETTSRSCKIHSRKWCSFAANQMLHQRKNAGGFNKEGPLLAIHGVIHNPWILPYKWVIGVISPLSMELWAPITGDFGPSLKDFWIFVTTSYLGELGPIQPNWIVTSWDPGYLRDDPGWNSTQS